MSDYTKLRYGHKNKVDGATQINGSFLVTVDSQEMFVDVNNQRIQIGNVVRGYTSAQIKAIEAANALPKIYLASDNGLFYFHDGTQWLCLSTKDAGGNDIVATYETKANATSNYNALSARIDAMHSFEIVIVNSLPATGEANKFYLVAAQKTATGNVYDEYIWVTDQAKPEGGYFEHIGTTEARLEDYYLKTELNPVIGVVADYDTSKGTLAARMDTAESDIDSLETRMTAEETVSTGVVGSTGYDTTKGTLSARMDDAEDDITDLETIATDVVGSTGYDTAKGTLSARADAVETDVASINRFKKSTVTTLPSVAEGDLYTIYFVAGQGDNKFAEYMLVDEFTYTDPTTSQSVTIPKHYEKINSEADLDNYYTKTEIDAVVPVANYDTSKGTIVSRIAAEETVSTDVVGATNYDTSKGTLATRVAAEETVSANVVGATGYDTSKGTLSARMDTAESDIDTAETDIDNLETRMDTAESDIDALETRMTTAESDIDTAETNIADLQTRMTAEETVSTSVVGSTNYDTTKGTLSARMDTAEGDINTLQSEVENLNSFEIEFVDELPATGEQHKIYFVPVPQEDESAGVMYSEWMWVVPDPEDPASAYFEEIGIAKADLNDYYKKSDINAIVGVLANYDTSKGTVAARLDGLDANKSDINHTHLYAGSQTAGGAADNVVETDKSSENAEHDMLIANANHDAVEYTTMVKVNSSTGQIAPRSVKLGDAVLVYDTNTESVVVNF